MPSYGLATYIAVSRMAANKHHFSDIVAGAGFGYGVGRLVTRRNSRDPDAPATPRRRRSLTVVPDGGPAGDGSRRAAGLYLLALTGGAGAATRAGRKRFGNLATTVYSGSTMLATRTSATCDTSW